VNSRVGSIPGVGLSVVPAEKKPLQDAVSRVGAGDIEQFGDLGDRRGAGLDVPHRSARVAVAALGHDSS
jgi:hypothetical protein